MTNFNIDELSQDAAPRKPDTVTLNEVTAAAEKLLLLEAQCDEAEAVYQAKKREFDTHATKTLPDLIQAAGLRAVPLADGTTIEVDEQLGCGIKAEHREVAHAWLREHGFSDLIKNEVTVTFGKGEEKDADVLLHNIEVMCQNDALHCGAVERQERVHPSTLKSFIKEQLKKGTSIPLDAFSVFVGQVARVKRPKRRD